MTNFIPIFPLGLVLYPGENLNLHIFEPRYRQLINECLKNKKPFGLPAVVNNRIMDYGTLVEITELSKMYDNGEMDIKTQGVKIFRILEVIQEVPEKLYSGAIVNYPRNITRKSPEQMRKLMKQILQLHQLLRIEKNFDKAVGDLLSYDVAHHIGLSLEEEYELLCLLEEKQRMEYLKRHLTRAIPLLKEMEHLKDKIKLNGHFKNLSGLDLGV